MIPIAINAPTVNSRICRELPADSLIVAPPLLYGLSDSINWKITDVLYLTLSPELKGETFIERVV